MDHSLTDDDPVFGPMNRMLRLAYAQDDRSFVLSMAAFTEDSLGNLLAAYMRPGKAKSDLLNGFAAPLGTLSARLKVSLALGLLTQVQYDDLELARKIRNEFAHGWEPVSLSSPKIAAIVERMSGDRMRQVPCLDSKARFYKSVSSALAEMERLHYDLVIHKRHLPCIGIQLVAGPPIADYRDSAA